MMRVVFEPGIIQGRFIGEAEIAQVRLLLCEHGGWSRWRLSRHLAQLWEWRSASGQIKDMAARTLLLKLEERGLIVLPPRRQASPIRRSRKPGSQPARAGELFGEQANAGVDAALAELLPLGIEEISRERHAGKQAEFSRLLREHHYLSHRGTVGENMQYLVNVTNNTRFLILPWVRVPHLASHVLGRNARRLSADWQAKYGHPIHLLETFVDTSRFAGTCYRAANWRMVGATTRRMIWATAARAAGLKTDRCRPRRRWGDIAAPGVHFHKEPA